MIIVSCKLLGHKKRPIELMVLDADNAFYIHLQLGVGFRMGRSSKQEQNEGKAHSAV